MIQVDERKINPSAKNATRATTTNVYGASDPATADALRICVQDSAGLNIG